MKNIFLLLVIVFISCANFAVAKEDCGCSTQTKCLDLMTTMYDERATLYNVLNLSDDQLKCKDVIDKKRYEELGEEFKKYEQEKYVLARLCDHNASKNAIKKQKKIVKDIETCMQKINKKYDNEFKSVLNSEQKVKLRYIRKIEKKAIKQCQSGKKLYKPDPNLKPFGEQFLYPKN